METVHDDELRGTAMRIRFDFFFLMIEFSGTQTHTTLGFDFDIFLLLWLVYM